MLLPIGVFAPALWDKYNSLKKCLILGLCVSMSIEVIQLLESYFKIALGRAVDIDDVILNVSGVFAGYYIYKGI